MAADVSCLVQNLGRYKEEGEGDAKAGSLVTRDLLGVCAVSDNQELDLDLKVPSGWGKRLDLMSGEVSCQPTTIIGDTDKLQDLNIPPLFPTFTSPPNLDLKLFPPSSSSTTTFHHSVCTLDKVKSALERAAKSKPHIKPERSLSPASSSITTTNSKKVGRSQGEEEVEEPRSSVLEGPAMGESRALMAAGCPSCLSYVLVSRDDPICPRCCSGVPLPAKKKKKPRVELDLNSDTMAYAPPAVTADAHL